MSIKTDNEKNGNRNDKAHHRCMCVALAQPVDIYAKWIDECEGFACGAKC